MNKRGFTLVELIVAIGLLSIMMLFMYDFLSDVSFEQKDDSFASLNQETRIEIEEYIINLFKDQDKVNTDSGKIYFGDKANNNMIEIKSSNRNKNIIQVSKNGKLKRKWTIKNAYFGSPKCENTSLEYTETTLIECKIKVYTENSFNEERTIGGTTIDSNNTIDDIIITYLYEPSSE